MVTFDESWSPGMTDVDWNEAASAPLHPVHAGAPWGGPVPGATPIVGDEVDTLALRAFNHGVMDHPRFAATILPMGDGLLPATLRP
jgi:hypothetical protein